MKNLLFILLVSSLPISSMAQDKKKVGADSTVVRAEILTGKDKDKILQSVYKDTLFLKACEIIGHNNEMISPKEGIVSKLKEKYMVTWKVSGAAKSTDAEYFKLIYEYNGKSSFVYFDEKNEKLVVKPKIPVSTAKLKWPPNWWPGGGGGTGGGTGGGGTGGGSGFCWFNWTNWITISQKCDYAFGCFFNNQLATFIQETRTCNNNPYNVQTRWVKTHCGC